MEYISITQFGKLRANFSEVADFVTIYIAEVRKIKRMQNNIFIAK